MTVLLRSAVVLALPLLVLSIRCLEGGNWDPSNYISFSTGDSIVDCANYSYIDPNPQANKFCVRIQVGDNVRRTCDIEFWDPNSQLDDFRCEKSGHDTVKFMGLTVDKYCCDDKDGCNGSGGRFVAYSLVAILALLYGSSIML